MFMAALPFSRLDSHFSGCRMHFCIMKCSSMSGLLMASDERNTFQETVVGLVDKVACLDTG